MTACFDRRHWAARGTRILQPGVHRVPLPLADDGLRAVNVYVSEELPCHGGIVMIRRAPRRPRHPCGDRYRNDLLGQDSDLPPLCRPRVRPSRQLVFLGSRDPEAAWYRSVAAPVETPSKPHVSASASDAPSHSKPCRAPGSRSGARHRLHATGQHDLVSVKHDDFCRMRDGGKPGQTQLVERRRRDRHPHHVRRPAGPGWGRRLPGPHGP